MTASETFSIRQMCDTYAVTPRTLRFYEQKELLFPARVGTQRTYGRACRTRLQLILRGKRFGFSLEDIRQLLDMYDPASSNEAQLLRTCDLARDRLAQMEAQRNELDEAITELRDQLAQGETSLATFHRTAAE
jgi:DNA-binding transcriptional MerR regulator